MVFEFKLPDNFELGPNIFNLIPSRTFGWFVWVITGIFIIGYVFYKIINNNHQKNINYLALLLPSILYFGTFTYTYGIVDEVSVNLEHPYNLYHFDKFSMSSEKMIDGTIEVIYYLLHTPFAQSQSTLILGNFVISLLVGWLHIFVLWRLPLAKSSLNNLILFSCFALSFGVISLFSNGFGNSLVSLLFLISICLCLKNKPGLSLLVSGVLPLIRPDGILWSLVNLLTIFVTKKNRERLVNNQYYWLLILLPFLATMIFLLFYKLAYGHWIPTPILFKSFKISMLPMFNQNEFWLHLFFWVLYPFKFMLVIVFLCLLYLKIRNHQFIKKHENINTLITYTVCSSSIFFFYNFTGVTIGDFTGLTYRRYWLGFEVILLLLFLVTISLIQISIREINSPKTIYFIPIFILVFLYIVAFTPYSGVDMAIIRWVNRQENVLAGSLTEKIFPKDFSISTSEMNTFGLMIDRPVIDLWGYTTRPIATSGTCNFLKIRNNENFFLETLPDVYWPYWFTESSQEYRLDNVERSLASFHYINKQGDMLGDLNKIISDYDIFFIKNNQHQFVYLVKKNHRDLLIRHFKEQNLQLITSKELDLELFDSLYNRQVKKEYNCS